MQEEELQLLAGTHNPQANTQLVLAFEMLDNPLMNFSF